MEDLKALGQAARKEMQVLSKALEERLTPFKMDRVSNWANQAQICRPHFWCYYRAPEDSLDDVAMAIGSMVSLKIGESQLKLALSNGKNQILL